MHPSRLFALLIVLLLSLGLVTGVLAAANSAQAPIPLERSAQLVSPINHATAGTPVTATLGVRGMTPQPESGPRFPGPRGLMSFAAMGETGSKTYGFSALAPLVSSPVITLNLTLDTFSGYTPGEAFTATLNSGAGLAVTLVDDIGWFGATSFYSAGRVVDIAGGDTVEFFTNGGAATLTLPTLTSGVDPGADEISGTISGVSLPVTLTLLTHGQSRSVTTDGSGNFSYDWTGTADIVQDDGINVGYEMTPGYWVMVSIHPQNNFTVYDTWNEMWGYTTPGEVVTVTIRSITGTEKETGATTAQARWGGGWWYQAGVDIIPGDEVEVLVGGETITDTVSDLTGIVDVAADTVSGTGPANSTLLINFWQREGTLYHPLEITTTTASGGSYTADFTALGGLDRLHEGYVYHADTARADTGLFVWPLNVRVDQSYNSVWGRAEVDAGLTITLTDSLGGVKEFHTVTANANDGWFDAGFSADVIPGDRVQVVGGSLSTTVPITTLTATADRAANTVFGETPANAAHLRVEQWESFTPLPRNNYDRRGFTSDSNGQYTADLSAEVDVRNGRGGDVTYHTADDPDENAQVVGYWAPYLSLAPTWNNIWGVASIPNIPVTLTVKDAGGNVKVQETITSGSGDTTFWTDFSASGGVDIVPGDTLVMDTGAFTESVTAVAMTYTVDPDNDLVAGAGPAWTLLTVQVNWQWPPMWVPTDGDGNFVADFGGNVDIRPGDNVQVTYTASDFDEVVYEARVPFFRANMSGDWVDGSVTPNAAVWVTATDSLGNLKGDTSTTARSDGWFDGVNVGGADLEPGDVVTVTTDSGLLLSATLITITGQMDVETDIVSGTMEGGVFPATGHLDFNKYNGKGWGWDFDIQADGSYSLNVKEQNDGQDVQPGDMAQVWYIAPDGNYSGVDVYTPFLQVQVNRSHDWVNGQVMPPATVYVTVTRGSQVVGTAQGWGAPWFNTNPQDAFGKNIDIQAGDMVTVTAGELSATIPVVDMNAVVDAAANVVSGQVMGVPQGFTVRVEIWKWGGDTRETQTDAAGNFSVDFNPTDVLPGDMVAIHSVQPDGHSVILIRSEMAVRIDFSDDNVEGNTEPGAMVTITARRAGSFVASANLMADSVEGGFWTRVYSDSTEADLTPGDEFVIQAGAEVVTITTYPTFTAQMDPDADTISGYGPPNMTIWVEVWDHCKELQTNSDGTGYYSISTNAPECGNYDLQPADQGRVRYNDANGHEIRLRFGPPNLHVEKYGQGEAAPGGRYQYEIRYDNWGNDAANVVITDTLPAGVTYVDNSMGYPASAIGNQVVITPGEFLAGRGGRSLFLTVDVDAGLTPGDWITNTVEIGSEQMDGDPGDNTAQDGRQLQTNTADVKAWKDPRPGDPAPGEQMIWQIGYHNDGGTGSGAVRLTDTLPVSMTVVRWWADEAGWTEVYSDGAQIAWERAMLPGQRGNWIYLVAQLDPALSTNVQLWNTVEIYTPNDTNPDNDLQTRDVWVKEPRWDVSVNKNFNGGATVAGQMIYYGIGYNNNGNSAAHNVLLTDTLPADMTYVQSGYWGPSGWVNVPYSYTVGNDYVWDLGTMIPGEWGNFQVDVRLDAAAHEGDSLTNTAHITTGDADNDPSNDTSTLVDIVYPSGPNLHVVKDYRWNGDGQLEYNIRLDNRGDASVSNIWLTDTYPLSTTFTNWWVQWGPGNSSITGTTSNPGEAVFWIEQLYGGDTAGLTLQLNLDEPGARLRWYTNTVTLSPVPGDTNPADNGDTVVAFSGGEVDTVDLDIYRTRIWGNAPQGPITITDRLTQTVLQQGGYFDIEFGDGFDPGEVVTVEAGSGLVPVVVTIPDPFTAYASSITETVWGQIDALDHQRVEVAPWDVSGRYVQTDGDGNYTATFSDLPRGAQGDVHYYTTIDYAQVGFHRRFQSTDLIFIVNYGHDWVEGNYEAGHTVWITVTNESGNVKGSATLATGLIPWWGGQTGFSTSYSGWIQRPDLTPGDWVYGMVDNGFTTTVRIGVISGTVDASTDTVSGVVDVPWLEQTEPVNVRCHPWGAPSGTPQKHDSVLPNGLDPYTCSWYGEWDFLPGNDIGVGYDEPDGDQVLNAFHEPAPSVRVNTWADANPGEGSNFVFHVQYWNNGDAPAEDAVITDTLSGVTYLTDTSGFSHTGSGGGPIAWNLGALPANSWGQFDVFVQVTAVQSETITATAQITTSAPYNQSNPWDMESTWTGHVEANDTHLNVGKGAWTWDPAPGYDFVYNVNVCNNGSTGSSEVTLTDTLPLSTTLVSWWGQHPGWGTVSSSANQLVVSRPSLSGWQCSEVYARVNLDADAQPGDSLHNNAVITASNDLEDNDNTTDVWHNVGSPRRNLYLSKSWNWGQLTPGGELRYNLNYSNNGNLPNPGTIWITETLPISTTFEAAWRNDYQGSHPVTPTLITAQEVVWEINGLDNGYGDGFEIILRIDGHASPGTVLTNCAAISSGEFEDSPYDDVSCADDETVQAPGPNLRVTKFANWQGTGGLQYQAQIENIGTTTVNDVIVTDTYPVSLTLNNWNFNFGQPWSGGQTGNQITLTLSQLQPGWTGWLNMWLSVPSVPNGTLFTNTVEITTPPGDVNPADNTDVLVVGAGPDLSVEKLLTGGLPKPGQLVTFTLHFKNDSQWGTAGNVWITDTLPAGLEFVGAAQRLCGPENYFCERNPDSISGQTLAWNNGPLCNGCWNDLLVTVRLTDTAQTGDVFTNTAEIASDNPAADVEPDYADNMDLYALIVLNPRFEVGKVYAGNGVAGTVVTYTLTVTNTGTETGTHVRLIDWIPDWLAYGGGGSYSAGLITWTLPSIAPNNGSATAWFSGTLSCDADVLVANQYYRVDGSDQGITSTNGLPVTFTTVSPTITAQITHTLGTLTLGDPVYFTATASTNGAPLSYLWDFGDGTGSSGLTASHVYTGAGTYTAALTAADTCGYTHAQEVIITVTDRAIAGLSASNSSPTVLGQPTFFTATITAGSNVSYTWDFGDGAGVNYDYTSGSGLGLSIPDNGCGSNNYLEHTITVPAWGILFDVDVAILDLRHMWDADLSIYLRGPDGAQVELSTGNGGTGDDYYGAVFDDDASTPITAGTPPFTGRFRPEGLLSAFEGKSTQGEWTLRVCDGGPTIAGTLNGWSLSLTTTTSSATGVVTHTYPAGGVYTAVVAAKNSANMVTATTRVAIDEPITGLSAANSSPTLAGNPTFFTATQTSGTNLAYVWAFGDGNTGSGASTAHTYAAAGVYPAVVTATNSAGVVTATTPVTVTGLAPSFTVGKVYEGSGVAGTVVTYTLTVTNTGNEAGRNVILSDTIPANLIYGHGDGTLWVPGDSVSWLFHSLAPNGGSANGWFSATLTCTAGLSIVNDDYRVVTSTQGVASPSGAPVSFDVLTPTITTQITHTPGAIVAGQTVSFTATASADGTPLSYLWDFGDGTGSSGLTASHVYTRAGTYTASFTATDACGYAQKVQTTVVSAVQVTLDPGEDGTLIYTDTQGLVTTIYFPAGAVTQTTTLAYTVVETVTAPSGFAFAGHAFGLEAYRNDVWLPGFTFELPVTVTIHYADAEVAGMDETALALEYWNANTGAWVDAACGPYDRHPDENWLSVPICHLSQFGLFGAMQHQLYLPLIVRSAP